MRQMVVRSRIPRRHRGFIDDAKETQQTCWTSPHAPPTRWCHDEAQNCGFLTYTINYLRHVIEPHRLKIAFYKADAIKHLQRRRNIRKLRSDLGLCNVLRRLVFSSAHIEAPLDRKI